MSEQWVHSGASPPSAMEWVDLGISDGEEVVGFDFPSELIGGLDINAEGMHRRFLSDLNATSDVYRDHQSFINELSLIVDSFSEIDNFSISIEDLAESLDAKMIENELCLHLPLMKESITVQTKEGDGFQLARLAFSEFPNRGIGPFRVPDGKRISMAHWEGDLLRMKVD